MVEGTIEKANGFDTSTVGVISAEGLRRDSFVAVGRAGADLASNALASAELADVGVTSGEKILPSLVIDTHASIPALGLAGDNSLESRQHALDDLVAQMPKSVFSGPRSGIQVRTLKWLGEFAAATATGDLKYDAHGIYDNLARAGFHPALIVLDSNINESYMGKFLIGDAMQRLKAGQPLPSDFAQSVDYYLAPAPTATEPLRMLGNIPDDITNTKLAKSGTINAVANADIGKVVESFSHPTANGTLRNALNNPSVADTVTTLKLY